MDVFHNDDRAVDASKLRGHRAWPQRDQAQAGSRCAQCVQAVPVVPDCPPNACGASTNYSVLAAALCLMHFGNSHVAQPAKKPGSPEFPADAPPGCRPSKATNPTTPIAGCQSSAAVCWPLTGRPSSLISRQVLREPLLRVHDKRPGGCQGGWWVVGGGGGYGPCKRRAMDAIIMTEFGDSSVICRSGLDLGKLIALFLTRLAQLSLWRLDDDLYRLAICAISVDDWAVVNCYSKVAFAVEVLSLFEKGYRHVNVVETSWRRSGPAVDGFAGADMKPMLSETHYASPGSMERR
ncbi:hypothetical protein G7046_g5476 [Stylonectria norvegica]|nr:hypothetical protein G7046_g5476 [Stylonectria norvegica]